MQIARPGAQPCGTQPVAMPAGRSAFRGTAIMAQARSDALMPDDISSFGLLRSGVYELFLL
jgi:hypothetical protein